jgi:hypothetical protein
MRMSVLMFIPEHRVWLITPRTSLQESLHLYKRFGSVTDVRAVLKLDVEKATGALGSMKCCDGVARVMA